MEKKTMDTLRAMISGELDDIVKKGTLSKETLCILKDLLDSYKNLEKIEKYGMEKGEMDMGYSQRKYYIDADYNPMSYGYEGMSYARGGNSYARGGMGGRSYMDGNSYMRPMYDYGMNSYARGYSNHTPDELVHELKGLMQESQDPAIKSAISEVIKKVEK